MYGSFRSPVPPGHLSMGVVRPVRMETLTIQATYEKLVNGGVGHAAAADMMLRYHGVDVEKTKWYKSYLVDSDSRSLESGLCGSSSEADSHCEMEVCREQVGKGVGRDVQDQVFPVSTDILVGADAECKDGLVASKVLDVVGTAFACDTFDTCAAVSESIIQGSVGQKGVDRDNLQGYCYLLMFRPKFRESLALRFGPYPWLSQLVGLSRDVWDYEGLKRCKVEVSDQFVHLSASDQGGALGFFEEKFREFGITDWVNDVGCRSVSRDAVDIQLGGKVRVGSVGDLSDYDVLQGLLKAEILIPLVYASGHDQNRYVFGKESLDSQPVKLGYSTHGLDTYKYWGHSKRSLVVLMPGQFVSINGVLAGSNSVCVGVVIPSGLAVTMLQRCGYSESSQEMDVRVIAIPKKWNASGLSLPDDTTQARFASNEAVFYLHSSLSSSKGLLAPKFIESVSVNDPFDSYASMSDIRNTVTCDGSLAVKLPIQPDVRVTVLGSFRSRREQDAEFSICDVLHIRDDEAAVAINTAVMDITLSSDRIFRSHVDDFSFHQRVLLDEYTYDGGGSPGDEGFPPAFNDDGWELRFPPCELDKELDGLCLSDSVG